MLDREGIDLDDRVICDRASHCVVFRNQWFMFGSMQEDRGPSARMAALASFMDTGRGNRLSVSAHQFGVLRKRQYLGAGRCLSVLCFLLCGVLALWNLGPASAAESQEPPVYLIGPGDGLAINVWREGELSTSTTVRPDGRITIPLVEDLMAAGKTPSELAGAISERLAQYLKDPKVTVTLVSGLGDLRQQIRVVGDVDQPSAIPYRSGMTLLDAVIQTGGLSRQADGNGAVIVRETDGLTREIPVRLADLVRQGDVTANVALEPGDVIVIPEGFFEGEWTIEHGVSMSQTVSDNIDQDPDGERTVGFVTRAGPNVSISGKTARLVARLTADMAGVTQFGGDNEGFTVDPNFSGSSTSELARDVMFLDLNGSVRRQLLDSRNATSVSGASTENRDIVAAFTASPYVVHRLADFADVEWRYRVSPVLVDSSNESNVLSQGGSLVLDSGPDFSFLNWNFTNNVRHELRSEGSDITTANTDFGVAYPLWRGFSVLGAIGYEYRTGDNDDDFNFDGVTWRTGFQWNPNPDLNLQANYGRRDDEDNFDASLNYQVGPKTSVNASYAESLETSQGRAISNLGQPDDDPELDPFTFSDDTTRVRTVRLRAFHNSGLDSFGLTGLVGKSDGGSDGDEDFYAARITWGRSLSQELSLNTSAGYDHSNFKEDNRKDDTYRVNLGLTYRLYSNAQAFASYGFEKRDSDRGNDSFYENAATVGLSLSF